MPKKPPARTLVDGQHVKGRKRHLKSAQKCFPHTF